MIENIRSRYNLARLNEVDPDFLDFEETMTSQEDLEMILKLLDCKKKITLPNPHNSILLYLLEITNEFDFYKARSNTTGGTPPDIDIDFDDRTAAIEWTIKKWGSDRVAKISTHGTYGVKSGTERFFKAIAPKIIWSTDRSYKINQKELNKNKDLEKIVRDNIPKAEFGVSADMDKVIENSNLNEISGLQDWISYMRYVENKVLTYGVHASGVVVSDFPLANIMPLMAEHEKVKREDGTIDNTFNMVTQLTMNEVEELGAIKFDFLGIDNLSIIGMCIRFIKKKHGIDIDMYKIKDGDERAYAILRESLLAGLWQIETSDSAQQIILDMEPNKMIDLSDALALNRPGPLAKGEDEHGNETDSIVDSYIKNKKRGYPEEGMPESLSNLLKSTNWAMIYQEQVMEVCSKLAGFTLREADDIRRAIGKKNVKYMEIYKDQFVQGCKKSNLSEEQSNKLWLQMVEFANYSFNKSHSVCYAYLTYVCAWLKANYPEEFFAALMTVRSKDNGKWSKAPKYIFEAKAMGIDVRGPDINRSISTFDFNSNRLYWGFQAIKGIGASTGDCITRARGNVKFKSVWDFLYRVDRAKINSGAFKNLILSGAFDCLGYDRSHLYENADVVYKQIRLEEEEVAKKAKLIEVRQENIKRAEAKAAIEARVKEAKEKKKKNQILTSEDLWYLDRKNRLRRYRDLSRMCKISGRPLSSDMTDEEIAEFEEANWLRKKPEPRFKELPQRVNLIRSKQLEITIEDLVTQKEYCGAYPGLHAVQIKFPNSKHISSSLLGEYGVFAGEVSDFRIFTTKKGSKMAVATLEDQTERADIVFFPRVWSKVVDYGLADSIDGNIVQIKGKVDSTRPYKIFVNAIRISKN